MNNNYIEEAIHYLNPEHPEMVNPTKAFSIMKEASDKGYTLAHFACGMAYETGCGVPRNADEAISYYYKGVMDGDVDCSIHLIQLAEKKDDKVNVALDVLKKNSRNVELIMYGRKFR